MSASAWGILEMLNGNLVAVHLFPAELAVERVKIQAMFARNEREGFFQVRTQLVRCPRFAGIISRGGQSATESATGVFKSAEVVALPAVERDVATRVIRDLQVKLDTPEQPISQNVRNALFTSGL